MNNQILLAGLSLFIEEQKSPINQEVFDDVVMFTFSDTLAKVPLHVKLNCSYEGAASEPFMRVWLDLTIPVKAKDINVPYNDIRILVNHANRENTYGKVWFEEFSNSGNLRWGYYQFLAKDLSALDVKNQIAKIIKTGIDEITPWIQPFISVAFKGSNAVKAIKKAGFDLYPYE